MVREDVKKTQKPTFFFLFYVTIEKAVQTICLDWASDKAGRDVCIASGLFGKPAFAVCALPILPTDFKRLPGSVHVSWLCSTAAPHIQRCTYDSNQPFREKGTEGEKNTFLSLVPSQATLILYSLAKTSGSCIFIS